MTEAHGALGLACRLGFEAPITLYSMQSQAVPAGLTPGVSLTMASHLPDEWPHEDADYMTMTATLTHHKLTMVRLPWSLSFRLGSRLGAVDWLRAARWSA